MYQEKVETKLQYIFNAVTSVQVNSDAIQARLSDVMMGGGDEFW
jgi:hypothetical protein